MIESGWSDKPKLERVLDRSIKAFFPGLLRMDRLAKEMSAVTRVMVILENKRKSWSIGSNIVPGTVYSCVAKH